MNPQFTVCALILTSTLLNCRPAAETPRQPPRDRYRFLDERTVGPFAVQRWIDEASPEVSPSGMCACITVAYLDGRRVLTTGDGTIASISIDPVSGRDINGDGAPDLVVNTWSGGAHCCATTTVYSVTAAPKSILAENTADCTGTFEDLDGDGTMEFVTCDAGWGAAYCSFAESPFPTVVFAYDRAEGRYRPATPRYAERYRQPIDEARRQAEAALTEPGRTPEADKCAILKPVLELMYTGRFDEGVALMARLYARPDAGPFTQETIEKVRQSTLWTAR